MLFADVSIMRSAKTAGGEHNDGSKGELLLLLILNFQKINVHLELIKLKRSG